MKENPSPCVPFDFDKFTLWVDGPHLRGLNVWQRLVYPAVDGTEFLGPGPLGPPFTQADFDLAASMGANYINISHAGLFTQDPPYVVDEAAQANLDHLLEMIAAADMFAVISFRTGPGRSDFTFYSEGIEEWGDPALLNDEVWRNPAAQDAWIAMWRYTAERYRNNPIVVGYDLMVEPNAADVWLDIWEPAVFYTDYAGTLYDWNQLYPRIVAGIREVDETTPILIAAAGYSAVRWLPYLQPVDDPRAVYMVHQYAPQMQYTHQSPESPAPYPGEYDIDWDGISDVFDVAWLDDYLGGVDDFQALYGRPVAVNEFGVVRWAPGAAQFMDDQMGLFEARGMNHAFWVFNPLWPPHDLENDAFDFLHGPDPNHHERIATSDLIDVVRAYWSLNTVRPSTLGDDCR